MSLRAFHIIFITIATLFCAAVAVWTLVFDAAGPELAASIMGYCCSVAAVCLPIYGVCFYRKSLRQEITSD